MNPFSLNSLGAIVIGGDYRGLGVVRSLGRHDVPVCVLTDEHMLAALSKYCRYRYKWPRNESEQTGVLLDLAKSAGLSGWSLFPTGDETAAFISANHEKLRSAFVLTTPPWAIFRWAYDKLLTYELADLVNVPHPATVVPRGRGELNRREWAFPLILKPSNKHRLSRFTRDKAWIVRNQEEMFVRYDDACRMLEPEFIMVQELIPELPNSEVSYAALVSDGAPIASLVARRTRQHPIDFGSSSSFVQTIDEPEVEHLAEKLLGAMRYSGLVEIEFKRDARDSRLKLLDINARVWGWHTLGARAGLDFSYLAWRHANGYAVARQQGIPGVGWVRATTDLMAFSQYLRRRRLSVWSYLRSLRGPLEFAIWAKDDPMPSLLEVPTLIYARGKFRRATRSRVSLTGFDPQPLGSKSAGSLTDAPRRKA